MSGSTPQTSKPPLSTPITARAADIEAQFPALHLTRSSRFARRLGRLLLVFLVVSVLAAFFVPWQQNIRGEGSVIARDPYERTQPVQSQLKGLVQTRGEGVIEGGFVEEGDLLFRVVDQNPDLQRQLNEQVINTEAEIRINRSALEQIGLVVEANQRVVEAKREEITFTEEARDAILEAGASYVEQARNKFEAAENKLISAKAKLAFAEADYERKKGLFGEGLEAEVKFQDTLNKFESAKADVGIAQNDIDGAANQLQGKQQELDSKQQEWDAKITKVQSELEKAQSEVAKAASEGNKIEGAINEKQNKLLELRGKATKQQLQDVLSPRTGYIMDLAVVEGMPVKPGEQLCRIVPKTEDLAVQVWVKGNDAPLIHRGDHVRLQFEGWPAVQFSGWPSVAVGTFGGTVNFVDPTDDGTGKFRIVVTPDEEQQDWPGHPYLRQGVRSNGWVLLDVVPLGYELWRRMNGFPPALKSAGEAKDSKGAKPPKIKI